MRILTAAQLREVDRQARDERGLPTIGLMEQAAVAVAMAVQRALKARSGARVFVVCGKGNNGGDGWAAARLLKRGNTSSSVVSRDAIETLSEDAAINARLAVARGIDVRMSLEAGQGDIVVDAILGTGITRPAQGHALELIEQVNAARGRGAYVIAVDLPSGLDADRHHPIGPHVTADETVTFHALKRCLVQYPTRAEAGLISVAPIGVPETEDEALPRWITRDSLRIDPRPMDAHKGTSGHVLVAAGSPGKSGAAMLACRGALRGGAGLVTLASTPDVIDRVLPAMPEVMGHALPSFTADALEEALENKRALVVGPGLAREERTARELVEALARTNVFAVLDADALNALAADRMALARLSALSGDRILTPHPAELARLLRTTTEVIQRDRFAAAAEAARKFASTVILKGACSVIAKPDGTIAVNSSGTPAMAVGGTGDVLAGLAGALREAVAAAWVHGRAGELAAGGHDRGLLATELADRLPSALHEITARVRP